MGGGLLWDKERKQQYREERSGYMIQYTQGKYEFLRDLLTNFQKEWQTKPNFGKEYSRKEPQKDNGGNGGTTNNTSTTADNLDSVTGSAVQIRNLTVNIEAFNKDGINTSIYNPETHGTFSNRRLVHLKCAMLRSTQYRTTY